MPGLHLIVFLLLVFTGCAMLSPIFGILLLAIPLIPLISCFKKKPVKEKVEPKPTPTPKTATTTFSPRTTTADSNVKTPVTVSKSTRSHLKPEPTQPSLIQNREIGANRPDLMEEFMNESFDEDPIEDDTRDDAQSLKPVHLEIGSDSFPLAKKHILQKEGKGTEGPHLVAKKSLDKVSLMKEDVTADDTDISVREQKNKVSGVLTRTKSLDQLKTKTRDEKTQSEKKHIKTTMMKMKKLATDREKARKKRRNTELERRRRSREEKSKEMEKSKEQEVEKTKSKDKSDDKSKDKSEDKPRCRKLFAKKSLEKLAGQSVISVECYRGQ